MSPEGQKRAAGEAAADLVESGMVVGLGTGSTAAWFVRALAGRRLDIRCVSTSVATDALARSLGLKTMVLDNTAIDLTVDGADEIGPGLALIKGGGGALLREKLVWQASSRCVVIADAAKQVATLGKFALPVEVVEFGHVTTCGRLTQALARHHISATPRVRLKDKRMLHTDSGNLIYDLQCGQIADPAKLAEDLKSITGVVEHGLFLGLAKLGLIGTDLGVISLHP